MSRIESPDATLSSRRRHSPLGARFTPESLPQRLIGASSIS